MADAEHTVVYRAIADFGDLAVKSAIAKRELDAVSGSNVAANKRIAESENILAAAKARTAKAEQDLGRESRTHLSDTDRNTKANRDQASAAQQLWLITRKQVEELSKAAKQQREYNELLRAGRGVMTEGRGFGTPSRPGQQLGLVSRQQARDASQDVRSGRQAFLDEAARAHAELIAANEKRRAAMASMNDYSRGVGEVTPREPVGPWNDQGAFEALFHAEQKVTTAAKGAEEALGRQRRTTRAKVRDVADLAQAEERAAGSTDKVARAHRDAAKAARGRNIDSKLFFEGFRDQADVVRAQKLAPVYDSPTYMSMFGEAAVEARKAFQQQEKIREQAEAMNVRFDRREEQRQQKHLDNLRDMAKAAHNEEIRAANAPLSRAPQTRLEQIEKAVLDATKEHAARQAKANAPLSRAPQTIQDQIEKAFLDATKEHAAREAKANAPLTRAPQTIQDQIEKAFLDATKEHVARQAKANAPISRAPKTIQDQIDRDHLAALHEDAAREDRRLKTAQQESRRAAQEASRLKREYDRMGVGERIGSALQSGARALRDSDTFIGRRVRRVFDVAEPAPKPAAGGAGAGGGGDDGGFVGGLLGGLSKGGEQFNSTLLKMGRQLLSWRGLIVAAVVAAGPLVAVLGSLGGVAIGAANGMVSLAGSAFALPGLFAAAATGVGALVLALQPVVEVFKAFTAQQKIAQAGTAQTAEAMRVAGNNLRDAQNAYQSASQGVVNAQYEERRSQIAVNEARRQAIRDLEDMRNELKRASLNEQGAILALKQAQLDYAKSVRDANATPLDRAEALLRVKNAEADLVDVRTKNKRLAEDAARAEKRGVEGNLQVVDARHSAAQASIGLGNATFALTKATADLAQAHREYAAGGADRLKADQALKDALDKLSPSTRKVADAVLGQAGAFYSLRKQLGEDFFGPIAAKMGKVGDLFKGPGSIPDLLGRAASAMGEVTAQGIVMVTSGPWKNDFAILAKSNATIISRLGDAGLRVADAFRNITIAALPFTQWVAGAIDTIATRFDNWSRNARADTDPNGHGIVAFLTITQRRLQVLGDIVLNVGKFLGSLFWASSDFTGGMFDGIEKVTAGWARWGAEQEKKGSSFRTWLEHIRPLLSEVWGFLVEVAKAFGRMAADPRNINEAKNILHILAYDVLPKIAAIFTSLSQSGIISLVATDIGIFLGTLRDVLDVIGPVTNFLLNAPVVGSVVQGISEAMVGLAAVTAIAKFTGLFKVIDGVRFLINNKGGLKDAFKDIIFGRDTAEAQLKGAATGLQAAGEQLSAAATQLKVAAGAEETAAGEQGLAGAAGGAAGEAEGAAAAGGGMLAGLSVAALASIALAVAAVAFAGWTIFEATKGPGGQLHQTRGERGTRETGRYIDPKTGREMIHYDETITVWDKLYETFMRGFGSPVAKWFRTSWPALIGGALNRPLGEFWTNLTRIWDWLDREAAGVGALLFGPLHAVLDLLDQAGLKIRSWGQLLSGPLDQIRNFPANLSKDIDWLTQKTGAWSAYIFGALNWVRAIPGAVADTFSSISRFVASLQPPSWLTSLSPALGLFDWAGQTLSRHQSGGPVAGTFTGRQDTHAIAATPGEYVIRRRAAQQPDGMRLLDDFNNERIRASDFYAGLDVKPMASVPRAPAFRAVTAVPTSHTAMTYGDIHIHNPVRERADRSVRRTLRDHALAVGR